MNNKNAQSYYDKMAEKIENPYETRNKAKDFTTFDVELMKRFADQNKVLLDLGSGTGLLINHLADDFQKIIAVEKYPEFSKFINSHRNVEIINEDLLDFDTAESVDIVSLFGVMSCFNREEAKLIYSRIGKILPQEGTLIVKNQMGIKEDVVINGWSDELQTNYFAEYRTVDSEIALLNNLGFQKIERVDIYPPQYNRWDNTHFYALICKKGN
ncbi:class I SAM-dependent methyltransferase [Paenibacillus radicis (ex Gao et al. 2016)]|uniref:Methyltransferase n=1 Tax=Paenibacillus radicis (ex Gao et al. 2016) TaxID=1737354 RepID=A0A917HA61_9BACL|nr:class I SAM-dependent methyltransferase [Paenibacillus radicis (ex Gao et al. 2016)]GGG72245.1 methyltransferase [Paenibacillus radicis (ex Gao et al. 2016)]